MDSASWIHQIARNFRSASSASTVRSSIRRSGPDGEPRQKPSRIVSGNPYVEVWRPASRAVSWNTHIEVFVIPARALAPDDCDPCFEPTNRAPDLRVKSFDDDQRVTSCSCEDDKFPPRRSRSEGDTFPPRACAGDDHEALEVLETNLNSVG